jgi:hypothetical protein
LPCDPLAWKNLFVKIMHNKTILSEFKFPKIRTFNDVESDFDKLVLKKIYK